jgi:hypothetical protein
MLFEEDECHVCEWHLGFDGPKVGRSLTRSTGQAI